MLRSLLISSFFTILSGLTYSQAIVQGTLIDPLSGDPLNNIIVRSQFPDETSTDSQGKFVIRHANDRKVYLVFISNGEQIEWNSETIASGSIDVGTIPLIIPHSTSSEEDFPTITLDENDDEESANISGLLRTGDDLFGGIGDYTFSPARFRRRGLEAQYIEGYLNNLPINDLETGNIFYSSWSGLNDVTRFDANVVGSEFSEWGFGGVAGSSNTDLSALSQRKRVNVSYAVTNRNYRNRIMATWSTGLLPSGWAFTVSGSRRWSQEGYIPGTFYDGWGYFASIGKKINNHAFNFVAMASPYKRGGNSTSILEMFDLADDHYYNSFWGYQQGEKRSARIYSGHQPLFILRHDWDLNENLSLSTSLGYQTGYSGVEALDWLYGNDPRPDYYRRLPSYVDDPDLAAEMRNLLSANESLRQIQWDNLYQINYNSSFSVEDANGIIGNTVTGKLSRYVMEDRRSDTNKKSGNAVLQYQLNSNSQLSLGVNVIIQDTRIYKELNDLLGGEFYLDWDKFAATDFPGNDDAQQNDLQRPNRILQVGDKFGYEYFARIRQQAAWAGYTIDARKWEIGVGASVKNHIYWRDGLTQNGKFPDNSLGAGEKHSFFLPSVKALLRYKFDGRNYLTVSGFGSEMAPTFRNVYVSPRTRDNVVSNLETEKILSGEVRYDYTAPYLKLSFAGFLIESKDGIESSNFYHDDERTFINFSLTNIDKRYSGIEAAGQYTITPGLTFEAAGSVGQYIYTSRPLATVTQDNDGAVLEENITVYAKNFYLGETPQSVYTAGLTYQSKQFWTLYLNVNRFERHFISINPLRRTVGSIDVVEYNSEQWNEIIKQEELDGAWTVDISFYKTFKVDWPEDGAILSINLSAANLLNNTNYINGGYEQYRFDFENRDVSTFPTRYSYMQGINFFIQAGLRF